MKIVVNKGDGTCSILTPAPEYLSRGHSVEDVRIKDTPSGLSSRIIDDLDIPQDRYFRGAWTDDLPGDLVDIDMTKAQVVHMDVIRIARDEAIAVLDIETMKGIDVQTEKQVLRDIPQTFDLTKAVTPEELKALWPTELVGYEPE